MRVMSSVRLFSSPSDREQSNFIVHNTSGPNGPAVLEHASRRVLYISWPIVVIRLANVYAINTLYDGHFSFIVRREINDEGIINYELDFLILTELRAISGTTDFAISAGAFLVDF